MTFTLSAASLSVFERTLKVLDAILDKAAAHCAARKIDPAVMAATRLIPDMFPFSRQIQIACDHAVRGSARLSGIEAPSFPDTETTLDELKSRIAKTLVFLATVDRKAIDAAPGREIVFKRGPDEIGMEATAYLLQFALPNFFFHAATAYDILRASGVEVGKRDFIGPTDFVKKG